MHCHIVGLSVLYGWDVQTIRVSALQECKLNRDFGLARVTHPYRGLGVQNNIDLLHRGVRSAEMSALYMSFHIIELPYGNFTLTGAHGN